MTAGRVRQRLDQLGRRRKEQDHNIEDLAGAIRETLAVARVAGVPMTEAAERLGLNRTTLYQVYLNAKNSPGRASPATR